MRIVYSSIEGYKCKNKDYFVLSYKNLDDELVEWIEERTIDNLLSRTRSEAMASAQLKTLNLEIHEQAFFQIRSRKYFLDFFIPKYHLAIEIDGSSHRLRRDIDKVRDKDFSLIGIKTIRVKSKHVLKGNLFREIRKGISK